MEFIADTMLGRLARWLRLMGYDVHYKSDFGDDEILANARERTILTRDRALFAKAKSTGLQVLLVHDTDIKGQLSQLKRELGTELQDTPGFSRCPLCNGEVEEIGGEKVWTCENCQKIYWEGGALEKYKRDGKGCTRWSRGCTKSQKMRRSSRPSAGF